MKDHKELEVWKESVVLVTEVYSLTGSFPKDEMYGLTSQVRRSAISIPSNISEGAARQTDKEFIHFLYVSLGSAAELETQIIIANNLDYIHKTDDILLRIAKVQKMLHGLIRHNRSKSSADD